MKILVVSDQENLYIWDHFDKSRFQDIDLVISCGDLKASYLSFLVTMIPKPLLYVHGNHDYRYNINPPEGCTCIEDTIFTYNNLRIAGLGGSIEYSGGPCQYTEDAMKKRIKKLSKMASKQKQTIDILVTHSPTRHLGDGDDWVHQGFECFYDIYDIFSPQFHLHGHQHLNYSHKASRFHTHKGIEIINGFDYYILDTEKEDRFSL